MEIVERKIFNQENIETGAVLSAKTSRPTTAQEKAQIEFRLINYAFDTLYPRTALNIYSDIYSDSPSIVVIKDINNLPQISKSI